MTRKQDPRTARRPMPAGELLAFTPVPRQSSRHDGWTPERQRAFIEALADTGSVEAACKAVDMSQQGAYQLRREAGAKSFRKAWQAAIDLGVARIEDVVMDRALNGVAEPIFYRGEEVGNRRRYNDRLLMFILRNRAPERFAEGAPKGLNAVSQMQLERLKQEWRKEWEAERPNVSAAEVRASIDRKVEAIRLRLQLEAEHRWAALTQETRDAWAHFLSLRDRDLDAMSADEKTRKALEVTWNARKDHFDPPDRAKLPPPPERNEDAKQYPPEGYSVGQRNPPPPKTVWGLKDEGFDP